MIRIVSDKCWDGMSETCGIFCDECRDGMSETRGIYVASTGMV